MEPKRHYRYCGLHIASEILLPEWELFTVEPRGADPEVIIRIDPELPPSGLPDFYLALEKNGARLTITDTATYAIRSGAEIAVNPHPLVTETTLRLFLLGTVWNLLCLQREILLLHTSVVALDGRVYAFAGPSGAGKSTMAAACLAAGGELIGDDLVRFDLAADEAVVVYPGAPRLKLWRETITQLGLDNFVRHTDHYRAEKFHLQLPRAGGQEPQRLHACFLLEWGEFQLQRLTGLDALQQLVQFATYHWYYLEPMGLTAAHWQQCHRILQGTPLYRLTRPRDLARLGRTIDFLPEHTLK